MTISNFYPDPFWLWGQPPLFDYGYTYDDVVPSTFEEALTLTEQIEYLTKRVDALSAGATTPDGEPADLAGVTAAKNCLLTARWIPCASTF